MTSDVNLCNRALVKLGSINTIASLTEDNMEARTFNTIYEGERDALLESHPWNFAIGRSTLSRDGTNPSFEYNYAYQLPSDCLRVLALYDSLEDFKIETTSSGKVLVTDEATVQIIYIRQITDPKQFSSLFQDAFVAKLSTEAAEAITGSDTKSDKFLREFQMKFKEAKRRDGQEGTAGKFQTTTLTKYKNHPRR